jgi:hypothetical protein
MSYTLHVGTRGIAVHPHVKFAYRNSRVINNYKEPPGVDPSLPPCLPASDSKITEIDSAYALAMEAYATWDRLLSDGYYRIILDPNESPDHIWLSKAAEIMQYNIVVIYRFNNGVQVQYFDYTGLRTVLNMELFLKTLEKRNTIFLYRDQTAFVSLYGPYPLNGA